MSAPPSRPEAAAERALDGNARLARGDVAGAVAAYRQAVELAPDLPKLQYNLATALAAHGEAEAAIAGLRRALALQPDYARAHLNLGILLVEGGRPAEALDHLTAAARDPDLGAAARLDRAHALFLLGRWRDAFADYEARSTRPRFDFGAVLPEWTGQPLAGRRLLLVVEQGIGDILQFVRFAQPLQAAGAAVVLRVPATVAGLVASADGVAEVVASDRPIPPCDLWAPLLSVPARLGTSTLPARVPYLRPDAAACARWAARLPAARSIRVGIVWAGNPAQARDALRSPRLPALRPLIEMAGAQWFGLQVGDGARDLGLAPLPPAFTDLGPELRDFGETAAVLANLDLVISSDTSVAHLAGALGRPVWVLLPAVPDWRWMLDRADSPWYPTMRLFRQPRPGDWAATVAAVGDALQLLIGQSGID